jgi:TolB-like protein
MNKRISAVILGSFMVFVPIKLYSQIGDVSKLAERFASDFAKKKGQVVIKKRVAVLEFENLSPSLKKYNVGAGVSAELSKNLADSTIFLLVEREKVSDLMDEIGLGMTGAVDPGTSVKAGKLLGAEYLVLGTVSEIGDKIIVNARMIAAESGAVISVQQISLPSEEVVARSKEYYFSAFQSKYGISVSLNQEIIFPGSDKLTSEYDAFSLDVTYRFSKHFRFGIGYFMIDSQELRRESETMAEADYAVLSANSYGDVNIVRNYNFSGSGPKFIADFVWPFFRWLNAVLRVEYIPLYDNTLEQDVADIPVWATANDGTQDLTSGSRILVTSWAADGIPHLFKASIIAEFLISKRLSLSIRGGYCISNKYTPEVYEVGGNRQWHDDIDQNGTFDEYHGFNFSRDRNGKRVSIDFNGFTAGLGIGIHF